MTAPIFTPTFRDPRDAFADAVGSGFLSDDVRDENYAGNWMYMHTDGQVDSFKSIVTRGYIQHRRRCLVCKAPIDAPSSNVCNGCYSE